LSFSFSGFDLNFEVLGDNEKVGLEYGLQTLYPEAETVDAIVDDF
jgi:hypothetical protein